MKKQENAYFQLLKKRGVTTSFKGGLPSPGKRRKRTWKGRGIEAEFLR